MSLRLSTLLAILAAAGAGCGSGDQNPPDGAIRVFHAAPGQGGLRFLRVERSEAELDYKGGSGVLRVDQDTYRFNVDVVGPGDPERVLTLTRKIDAETEYSFILYEPAGRLEVLEYTKPSPSLAGSSDAEVQLFHLAPGVGPVDVYLLAPGTSILGAPRWAAVGFAGRIDPELRPAGDYQLTFTAPDDPATVLFSSTAFTLAEGGNVSFSVVAGAGLGTAPLSVVISDAGGVSGEVFDQSQQAALRAFHAARSAGPLDIFVSDPLAMPLFGGLAFGAITGYETVPGGNLDLTVTPADDPGVLEVDRVLQVPTGSELTLLVVGQPGELSVISAVDDNRSIPSFARLRVLNQAPELGNVDLYVVEPGTDITSVSPTVFGLQAGASSGYLAFAADDYELLITDFGGDAPFAGPVPIQLSNGGVYGVIVIDGADMGTAEVFLLDDFLP